MLIVTYLYTIVILFQIILLNLIKIFLINQLYIKVFFILLLSLLYILFYYPKKRFRKLSQLRAYHLNGIKKIWDVYEHPIIL